MDVYRRHTMGPWTIVIIHRIVTGEERFRCFGTDPFEDGIVCLLTWFHVQYVRTGHDLIDEIIKTQILETMYQGGFEEIAVAQHSDPVPILLEEPESVLGTWHMGYEITSMEHFVLDLGQIETCYTQTIEDVFQDLDEYDLEVLTASFRDEFVHDLVVECTHLIEIVFLKVHTVQNLKDIVFPDVRPQFDQSIEHIEDYEPS